MWESQHLIEDLARARITERTTPTRRFPRAGRPSREVPAQRRRSRDDLGG